MPQLFPSLFYLSISPYKYISEEVKGFTQSYSSNEHFVIYPQSLALGLANMESDHPSANYESVLALYLIILGESYYTAADFN